jgi:hypothetical protein
MALITDEGTSDSLRNYVPDFYNCYMQINTEINNNFEQCRLLGCGAVWVYYKPPFRRNVSPQSSGYKKLREGGKVLHGC